MNFVTYAILVGLGVANIAMLAIIYRRIGDVLRIVLERWNS